MSYKPTSILSTHHMAVDSRMNQMLAAIVRTQTCESCWMHWMRLECQMPSVTCPAKCREFKSKSNDKIGNHGHMSWRFGLRLNPTWFHGGTLSLQLAMPPSGRKDSGVWKGGRTESTLQNIIRICVYIYKYKYNLYIYIYYACVCVCFPSWHAGASSRGPQVSGVFTWKTEVSPWLQGATGVDHVANAAPKAPGTTGWCDR